MFPKQRDEDSLSVYLSGTKNNWQHCVAITKHSVIHFAHDNQPEDGLCCLVKAALSPHMQNRLCITDEEPLSTAALKGLSSIHLLSGLSPLWEVPDETISPFRSDSIFHAIDKSSFSPPTLREHSLLSPRREIMRWARPVRPAAAGGRGGRQKRGASCHSYQWVESGVEPSTSFRFGSGSPGRSGNN